MEDEGGWTGEGWIGGGRVKDRERLKMKEREIVVVVEGLIGWWWWRWNLGERWWGQRGRWKTVTWTFISACPRLQPSPCEATINLGQFDAMFWWPTIICSQIELMRQKSAHVLCAVLFSVHKCKLWSCGFIWKLFAWFCIGLNGMVCVHASQTPMFLAVCVS